MVVGYKNDSLQILNYYKLYGDELEYGYNDKNIYKLNTLSDEELNKRIVQLTVLNNTRPYLKSANELRNTWVFIYTDILIKRRINKINKIRTR